MTRKDYELIAAAFADTKPANKGLTEAQQELILSERRYLANTLAARLRATNPRFDTERFLAAAGAL